MPVLYDQVVLYARDNFPDKLAIVTEEDGSRTYGELADRAGRLAYALYDPLGLPVGGRVSVWMQQRPEWIETSLALSAAGLSAVAANPQWTDSEYAYVLTHSGSRAIVCDQDRLERALRLRDEVGCLEHVITLGEHGSGALAYEALLADAPADSGERLPELPETAEGALNYTSGTTTGRPKAVVSQRAAPVTAGAFDFREMFGLNDRDRGISITPFFHGNGLSGVNLALGVAERAASSRGPVLGSAVLGLVDRYRPTYMITLAPLVNILMSLPPSDLERSHSFRVLVVLGSGPNMAAMEERYGTPVID